uniref:Ubiquinol oxidase n=1 Tax=Chlamydomonas reinhardtii TaxID=3055 RepID=Q8S308_CHLRE|nr:quinol-to-oxygen oxidoreductase [Chlamydomonas reinhardtii]
MDSMAPMALGQRGPCVRTLQQRRTLRACPVSRGTVGRLVVRAVASPPKMDTEAAALKAKASGVQQPVYFADSVASVSMDEECSAFIDRDGDFMEVMCCDYGFRSGASRMYQQENDGRIPKNAFQLGWDNFKSELRSLRQSIRFDDYSTISEANPPRTPMSRAAYSVGQAALDSLDAVDRALEAAQVLEPLRPRAVTLDGVTRDSESGSKLINNCAEIRSKLKQLKLSNKAMWDREHAREQSGRGVETPWLIKGVYLSLCLLLDFLYENRPIQRFWFLETVARMPYFSYISMLHLYESLGWWRAGAELRKIHFAEEWNELHHLQIMESLGGDQLWFDRFAAQHAAILYYWILLGLYVFSPRLAYNFSELIEYHAVDTYGEFWDANEELLKSLPPPLVAAVYYRSQDLYMFDSFQTSQPMQNPRRPSCKTLYDVFKNICDDEMEHVKTMKACQDETVSQDIITRREDGPRVGL